MIQKVQQCVRPWLQLGSVLLLAVTACGGKTSSENLESNTNWLQGCDSDAECGSELACHCGVCTQTCTQDSCPARLACLDDCGSVAACQAECTQDSDCSALDNAATCSDGVCQIAGSGLSTEDVSTPPDASNPPGEDVCRVAYVGYPAGASVPHDACGRSCTCQADGELVDCAGILSDCEFHGRVQPCSEMFPDLAPGQAPPSDAISIENAVIQDAVLTLDVGHSGGCERHDYAMCFTMGGESYPVNATLHFIHDAHDDGCEAYVEMPLRFDLGPLGQQYLEAYPVAGDILQTNYGIYAFGELSCEARETGAALEMQRATEAISLACEIDADCVLTSNDTGCHLACGSLMSQDSVANFDAARQRIDQALCADYESAGCGPVIAPPCVPPNTPTCVEGQCVDF